MLATGAPDDLRIFDSVPVLLVGLVCFLGLVVDGFDFLAILMFTVLIFLFFLNKSPFNISWNNGLVMMNSFSFTLSGKHFICPSILNDSFAG